MSIEEKFCLKWSDFEKNISEVFAELRDDEDFFDMTLACEQRTVQAHKLVLSACSPFFKSLLKTNKHPHPLLYLKGVKYEEIQLLLNFMYHGEVSIPQAQLSSFLALAEDLQIKGLSDVEGRIPSSQRNTSAKRPLEDESTADAIEENTKAPKQAALATGSENITVNKGTISCVKSESIIADVKSESIVADVDCNSFLATMACAGYDPQQLYQEQMRQLSQRRIESFDCHICNKSYANQYSLNIHIQTHEGKAWCSICQKNLSSPAYLKTHMAQVHKEYAHNWCSVCFSNFKSNDILKKHIEDKHTAK